MHKQVEIVFGTDLTVPMVHSALETSGPFAAHLRSKIFKNLVNR